MTKSLTEQWKDGTLEAGDYYCRRGKFSFIGYPADGMLAYRNHDSIEIVEEVLAPVPSYDKLKEMIDGDKETIRHLKKILPAIKDTVNYDYLKLVIEDFEKSIKDFEGVK